MAIIVVVCIHLLINNITVLEHTTYEINENMFWCILLGVCIMYALMFVCLFVGACKNRKEAYTLTHPQI